MTSPTSQSQASHRHVRSPSFAQIALRMPWPRSARHHRHQCCSSLGTDPKPVGGKPNLVVRLAEEFDLSKHPALVSMSGAPTVGSGHGAGTPSAPARCAQHSWVGPGRWRTGPPNWRCCSIPVPPSLAIVSSAASPTSAHSSSAWCELRIRELRGAKSSFERLHTATHLRI